MAIAHQRAAGGTGWAALWPGKAAKSRFSGEALINRIGTCGLHPGRGGAMRVIQAKVVAQFVRNHLHVVAGGTASKFEYLAHAISAAVAITLAAIHAAIE